MQSWHEEMSELVARRIRLLWNTLAFVDRVYTPPNDFRKLRQLRCTKAHLDAKSANNLAK